ncbi:hypothetical protein PCE1_003845 [Barthelona sp. PCE]
MTSVTVRERIKYLKSEIKGFERSFQQINGRKPTKKDITVTISQYIVEFKTLKSQLKDKKTKLTDHIQGEVRPRSTITPRSISRGTPFSPVTPSSPSSAVSQFSPISILKPFSPANISPPSLPMASAPEQPGSVFEIIRPAAKHAQPYQSIFSSSTNPKMIVQATSPVSPGPVMSPMSPWEREDEEATSPNFLSDDDPIESPGFEPAPYVSPVQRRSKSKQLRITTKLDFDMPASQLAACRTLEFLETTTKKQRVYSSRRHTKSSFKARRGGRRKLVEDLEVSDTFDRFEKKRTDSLSIKQNPRMIGRSLAEYFDSRDIEPRQYQTEVVHSIIQNKNTLLIAPTGYGKSVTYQIAAEIAIEENRGVVVVIAPLISLMDDQIRTLPPRLQERTGVFKYGGANETVLKGVIDGTIKIVFLAVERLSTPIFARFMAACTVAFVVIDEAHCISEWSHTFRPAYFDIPVKFTKDTPFLGLTATASQRVIRSISAYLGIENVFRPPKIINTCYNYRGILCRNFEDRMRVFYDVVKRLGPNDKLLVYFNFTQHIEAVQDMLQRKKVPCATYYGRKNTQDKEFAQNAFLEGKIRILLITTSFAMGIDIPDITRLVMFSVPRSPEMFVQVGGRVGRGDPSKTYPIDILFDRNEFYTVHTSIARQLPPKAHLVDAVSRWLLRDTADDRCIYCYHDRLSSDQTDVACNILLSLLQNAGVPVKKTPQKTAIMLRIKFASMDDRVQKNMVPSFFNVLRAASVPHPFQRQFFMVNMLNLLEDGMSLEDAKAEVDHLKQEKLLTAVFVDRNWLVSSIEMDTDFSILQATDLAHECNTRFCAINSVNAARFQYLSDRIHKRCRHSTFEDVTNSMNNSLMEYLNHETGTLQVDNSDLFLPLDEDVKRDIETYYASVVTREPRLAGYNFYNQLYATQQDRRISTVVNETEQLQHDINDIIIYIEQLAEDAEKVM